MKLFEQKVKIKSEAALTASRRRLTFTLETEAGGEHVSLPFITNPVLLIFIKDMTFMENHFQTELHAMNIHINNNLKVKIVFQ